jgi:hypothetical protein
LGLCFFFCFAFGDALFKVLYVFSNPRADLRKLSRTEDNQLLQDKIRP